MKTAQNLTGQTFGRWTVLSRAPNQGHLTSWLCKCECGTERTVLRQSLAEGRSKSCGCFNLEAIARRNHKHGHAPAGGETGTYLKWKSMKRRCFDVKAKGYRYYGGRGITVCERWRDSFANFLADMGECPFGRTLDRKDPNGNYEPSNCRWATYAEQTRNRRPFLQQGLQGETGPGAVLTLRQVAEIREIGRSMTQCALAERYGVSQPTISLILNRRTWLGEAPNV